MPQVASVTTQKLTTRLTGDNGVSAMVAAAALQFGTPVPAIAAQQILAQNVAAEVVERSSTSKYPLIHVYCSKVVNELREKFRNFSGEAQMVIEARVSQDRLEDMEAHLHIYVDAITQVLDGSRGDWGDGVFYGGGYEIAFGGVKHGGRNFMQTAKITFALGISTD